MRHFQDTFEIPKPSFVNAFSICTTAALIFPNWQFTKVFTRSCSAKMFCFEEFRKTHRLCLRLFLNKVLGCKLWTLWKRSSPQVFFIWILGYFSQRLFNKTFLSGCSFSIILKLVLTGEIKTCCIITLYRQQN